MKNSMKSLMVAAACSGLFTGATAIPAMAQTQSSQTAVTQMGQASFVNASLMHHIAKHSCKGQNNCKGQGGCKTGDNGCKGKNSCKGKGGCATNGHKMPKAI